MATNASILENGTRSKDLVAITGNLKLAVFEGSNFNFLTSSVQTSPSTAKTIHASGLPQVTVIISNIMRSMLDLLYRPQSLVLCFFIRLTSFPSLLLCCFLLDCA